MMDSLLHKRTFMDKLTEVTEANYSNRSFGVSELTKEMGISHSSLHRRLKSTTEQSISLFIREIRLKHAMELLLSQTGSVTQIAYEVGFGSTTYFCKCFHDHYGFPPGDVLKRYV
jgi:AraC-like DNA-binding protein